MTKIRNARELLVLHEFQPVPWDVRLKIMLGVTSGISFLHENDVVHCDLNQEIYSLVETGRENR